MKKIGLKIKEARKTSRITQEDLANAIGVSDKSISAYESDRISPPIKVLEKIARETDLSLSYFLEEKTEDAVLNKLNEIEKFDILITGIKNNPVNKIAKSVSKLITDPSENIQKSLTDLKIGSSKTAQVLAILELTKRLNSKEVANLTSAKDVYAQCFEIINQEKESLIGFYLNARGELIKKEIIAVGFLNRVNLLPREIFSLIKELPVAGIILAHNHPSEVLEPSDEDILFTKRVKEAGDILGVKLLDHLIVSKKGWARIKA